MKKQKIIWTVLPNGYSQSDPTKLRLSIFVSPRLSSDSPNPTLGEFGDFLDWPAKVSSLSFSLQFGAGAPVAATRVGPPLESTLWTAMFKSGAKVDSYAYEPQDNKYVLSYPYANVHDWIKKQYQDIIAASPLNHPPAETVADKLEPIMFYEAPDKVDAAPTLKMMRFGKTDFPIASDMKLATVGFGKEYAQRVAPKVGQPRTRLQTANVHTQLKTSVLSNVAKPLFATAALDMQHLTQDPTIVFKSDTLSALNSIYSELGSNKAVDTGKAVQPTKDFLQTTFFHRPKSPTLIAVAVPQIDFHEAIASLGNYPEIMKRVGLVIELEVPASAVAGDTVRLITPIPDDAAHENVLPKTKFDHNGGTKFFQAKSKVGSEIKNGLLDVSQPKYRLVNLDVDGAAMKVMALANTLRHFAPPKFRDERLASDDPVAASANLLNIQAISAAAVVEEASLPALRTNGINLVKTNMATTLVALFSYSTTLNSQATAVADDSMILYADDIVAGYRVDVWDSLSNSWRSLCKRKGAYTFSKIGETRAYDDEGFVELGVAAAADDGLEELKNTYYMPEIMTSWDGWSKVAPPPGKTIIQGDDPAHNNASQDDTWIESPNAAATDYGLKATFRVEPGSLPRLRYGVKYRMRIRTVDLAGNGLTLTAAPSDFTSATSEIPYTRFEPVPSPYLVPKTGIKPGESVEHVVIRSNFNKTAAEYGALFPIPDYSAYPAERHVVPPRQTQRMAEQYGRFDDPGTGKPSPSTYNTIINNDSFYTPFDPTKASKAVRPEGKIDVPWLPDIAKGATFRGLPGMGASEIKKMDFGPYTNWPDLKPFILRLVEGEGIPEGPVDEGGVNVFTLKLSKSDFRQVLYSSNINADDLTKMAVWDWLKEAGAPDQTKAIDGLNWSITPYRGMTFIHAIQQPLEKPTFKSLKGEKSLGETFAWLSGKINFHGKSTAQLDIYAEWTDPIDDLALPKPKDIKKKNLAFQDGVNYDDTALEFPPAPESESDSSILSKVRDKKAISIIGAARSTTSYLAEKSPIVAKQLNARSGAMKNVAINDKVADKVSDKKAVSVKDKLIGSMDFAVATGPTEQRRRHDFGDTKYHQVKYWAIGTTRFREYFLDVIEKATPPGKDEDIRVVEGDTARGMITRTGDEVTLDILNSARPHAPKILYVIPTFAWDKEESGNAIVSKRITGLRIWMERPWYSSGAKEMLGVIVWPSVGSPKKAGTGSASADTSGGKFGAKTDIKSRPPKSGGGMGIDMVGSMSLTAKEQIPEKLLPYVTQWGADPIWLGGRLTSLPKIPDFLNPAATDNGLSMEEFPSKKGDEFVGVAAYNVGYDQDRRLWYCDIEVNPHEAYFPFLRLALARYQAKSVVDAHLSRIVMADFIQVAPDRSATITFDSANARKVRVAVTGLAYRASAAGQFPSEVEITVETATGPIGDLKWIPADDFDNVQLDRLGGIGQKLWDGIWAGEVTLPADRGSVPMRLVVREFEVLLGDGDKLPEGFDVDGATAAEIKNAAKPELRRRLVYADVIEI